MVSLPRTCRHCGASINHYGACGCPDATLGWIDVERAALTKRLGRLEEIEKEAVEAKLKQLWIRTYDAAREF